MQGQGLRSDTLKKDLTTKTIFSKMGNIMDIIINFKDGKRRKIENILRRIEYDWSGLRDLSNEILITYDTKTGKCKEVCYWMNDIQTFIEK